MNKDSEMDIAVAHAMGWGRAMVPDHEFACAKASGRLPREPWWHPPYTHTQSVLYLPAFSTDPAAAFMAWEHFKDEGWKVWYAKDQWMVGDIGWINYVAASTFPLAISLAVLKHQEVSP